jgi:hypothetical protein
MHYRKLLLAAAVVLPGAGVFAAAGPASAASTPIGIGTINCGVGGDITFTPPLTQDGTPGYKNEVVQFNLEPSNCTGPGTNTPQPTPTSATATTKPIKVKDIKMGKTKVAGACGNSDFNPTIVLKSTLAWVGTTIKDTKTDIGPMTSTSSATEPGLMGSGTSKKSYAGDDASATLYIDMPSAQQIQSVCATGGTGSLSELSLDSTTSTLTIVGALQHAGGTS